MSLIAKLATGFLLVFIATGQIRTILPQIAKMAADAQSKPFQYGQFSKMLTGEGRR